MDLLKLIHTIDLFRGLPYLGIWLIRSRPPAKAHAPPAHEYATDYACQTAFPDNVSYGDPDYPWEAYV